MKLLKKLFPTIFDAKNTNKVQKKKIQNTTKDRMTHFKMLQR